MGSLNKYLTSKIFATDADVKQALTSCLQTFGNDFFYGAIQAMVSHRDKFSSVNGDYVELLYVLCATLVPHTHTHIQGVPWGMCQSSGECCLR